MKIIFQKGKLLIKYDKESFLQKFKINLWMLKNKKKFKKLNSNWYLKIEGTYEEFMLLKDKI